MSNLARRPLTLVELDLPYCTRRFGVLPCRAALSTGEMRTNHFLRSQEVDNAIWTKTNATITANASGAPDGTTTADRLRETAITGSHRISQSLTITSGQVWTISAWVKADGRDFAWIDFPNAEFGAGSDARFDLSTGETNSAFAEIEAHPSGFYRISATLTAVASGTVAVLIGLSSTRYASPATTYLGDVTKGVLIWGLQAEVGAGASTYKATTTAAVAEYWGRSAAKCFHSRATCADPTQYAAGSKTITFAPNIDGIPDAPGVYPCLLSADSRPGELNLSGFDPASTALGVRARIKARLQDFANNDTWLDAYQSERVSGAALASGVGYNPLRRGHHLTRLFSRWPYYLGLPLRVRRGFVGDDPPAMPTEHYVVSGLTGPNAAGVVEIEAKDILDLAENDKAVIPAASTGKLSSPIAADATAATLTPAGVGDAEYPASGLLRIGRELIGFTRAGDALTLTRGQDGTAAASHAALDVAQICVVIEDQSINEAAETILKYGTDEFDAYIPTADWAAENLLWYGGMRLGRVILSKPTGKKTLVGELCQLGVMIWWDAVAQYVQYKVNSPLLPDESYISITDDNNLIIGSPDVDRADDQRASEIWLFHGIRDWTDDSQDGANYDKLVIGRGTENLYAQDAIKKIYCRWFGAAGNDAAASVIVERLYSRFSVTPNVISGKLDVKDRASVTLGARVLVESYVLQGVDGAILAEPMQISRAEYTDGRVDFRAESFRFSGQFGFWLDSATAPADWDSATEAQRATGAFWADAEAPDDNTDQVWF